MKSLLKNKKIIIGVSAVLIILLIIGGIILLNNGNKNSKSKDTTKNYVAFVKINPSIKLEYTQTCKETDEEDIFECDEPVVTKYDLVNEDAKNIYKDINLLDSSKDLFKVLNLICETAKDNGVVFEKVDIYSDWDKIENYINEKEEISGTIKFNILITNKDNITTKIEADENNIITYNVSFDTDGGNKIESQVINKDEKVTKPTNPTRDGYNFIEWQLNGKKFDFKQEINSDIKLTAKWEKIENSTNNSNKNENNTNNNTTNNNATNNQNNTNDNSNKNEETTNNNTKPVEKAYLNSGILYSLDAVKEIENKYNIKINLVADAKCGYIDGGDNQLIESGKTYTVHIASLDPFVYGACGVDTPPEEWECLENDSYCAMNLFSTPELLSCAKQLRDFDNAYWNYKNSHNNTEPLISDMNISSYNLLYVSDYKEACDYGDCYYTWIRCKVEQNIDSGNALYITPTFRNE